MRWPPTSLDSRHAVRRGPTRASALILQPYPRPDPPPLPFRTRVKSARVDGGRALLSCQGKAASLFERIWETAGLTTVRSSSPRSQSGRTSTLRPRRHLHPRRRQPSDTFLCRRRRRPSPFPSRSIWTSRRRCRFRRAWSPPPPSPRPCSPSRPHPALVASTLTLKRPRPLCIGPLLLRSRRRAKEGRTPSATRPCLPARRGRSSRSSHLRVQPTRSTSTCLGGGSSHLNLTTRV